MLVRPALVALVLAVIAGGCGGAPGQDTRTPEEVATATLEAMRDADWPTVYALASSSDKAARDSVEYVEAQPSGNSAMEARTRAVIAFEQASAEVGDSTAMVTYDYTGPDTDAMTADLMGAFFGRALAGEEIDETEVADAIDRAEIPTVTTRKTIRLVREAEGWRVAHDWDYAQMVTLADVALDKSDGDPDWGIPPRASVTGELTNTGDRDVSLVKVRLVLLNADGAPFDETIEQVFYAMGDEPPVRTGYVKEWAAYLDESVVERVASVRAEVSEVQLVSE